jgi:hypothetical protein
MVTVQAQKLPTVQVSNDDIIAQVCYHYPQYTFTQAKKLPHRRIMQLLRVARAEQAREWYNQCMIAASPHGKKNSVKDLVKQYKNMFEGVGI